MGPDPPPGAAERRRDLDSDFPHRTESGKVSPNPTNEERCRHEIAGLQSDNTSVWRERPRHTRRTSQEADTCFAMLPGWKMSGSNLQDTFCSFLKQYSSEIQSREIRWHVESSSEETVDRQVRGKNTNLSKLYSLRWGGSENRGSGGPQVVYLVSFGWVVRRGRHSEAALDEILDDRSGRPLRRDFCPFLAHPSQAQHLARHAMRLFAYCDDVKGGSRFSKRFASRSTHTRSADLSGNLLHVALRGM